MRTQDSIADLLTCLRNAQMAELRFFYSPYSKIKEGILNVLYQSGYIVGFFVIQNNKKTLVVFPKFYNFSPTIKCLVRLSKPSVRIYYNMNKLLSLTKKLGIVIFTSSFGVISSIDAFFLHCCGEALCVVE